MLDDMHDGTVAQGDTWLSTAVPALLASPAWTEQNSLLVITWDEDDNAPGNQVATFVIASGVPAGFTSAVAYNHYSLLRTIEAAWGLERAHRQRRPGRGDQRLLPRHPVNTREHPWTPVPPLSRLRLPCGWCQHRRHADLRRR